MIRPGTLSLVFLALSLAAAVPVRAAETALTLERLTPTSKLAGFRAVSLYLNDADRPMGVRFVHERTGFVLDVLQIQSVPQGFIWVNSPPTSDQGEPHTQEHLLLGKGNMGRGVATQEPMSLATSSAFTLQWRTCYDFLTNAGPEVFYQQFAQRMDALLHPDYSDEEIRREVRNFGVTENPADHSLRLEEKGTVYNEMVGSTANQDYASYHTLGIALYGKDHAAAYVSGGTPEGIRQMSPADIRNFHARNYVLGNMGMIASLPKEMPLAQVLERVSAILTPLEPSAAPKPFSGNTAPGFAPPQGAPAGTIAVVDYPDQNADKPGTVALAWAPVRALDAHGRTLLRLFLATVAGDATTNLYKRFVDSKTRVLDFGAQSVSNYLSNDPGNPVYLGVNEVATAHLNPTDAAELRRQVMDEFQRIATWKNGSPELAEFNARVRSRLVATRREAMKFVNSPPGFGFRGTYAEWMDHLLMLESSPDFRRSVTLKPELAAIERQLAAPGNPWHTALAEWKLLDTPYVVATRANPAVQTQLDHERQQRIAAEVARLRTLYGFASDQDAITHYRAAYDSTTAELEAAARTLKPAKLVDALPLTLDAPLEYAAEPLAGGIPYVKTTFENMTSATTGMAFRLNGLRDGQLLYLALLPSLLTEVGVVENGRHIPYEQMKERLRNEILSLDANYSVNERTERYELTVRASGNDATEALKGVEWMRAVMLHADWSAGNLSRIRDVVDQSLSGLRNLRQGADENWVSGVGAAYRRQDSPLYLATSSFLTQTNSVLRLRWQLMEASPTDRDAAADFLARLAAPGSTKRAELAQLIAAVQGDSAATLKLAAGVAHVLKTFDALTPRAHAIAIEAAKDLSQSLTDLPDATLASDWSYLCEQMRHDLQVTPEHALAELEAVRGEIIRKGNARVFTIGAPATLAKLSAAIQATLASLGTGTSMAATRATGQLVLERLSERDPAAKNAQYVGLLNPNSQGGVVINSAPFVSFADTGEEPVLRYLAGNLYAGGGAHSVFMKTWGAGLAYSNGISASPETGRQGYYAERTPELPQTVRFVIDQLKSAKKDPALAEYAVSLAFNSRAASGYESRGEAMAANLADGVTPEIVSGFRKQILALRGRPNLTDALFDRMPGVYARVLPGYAPKAAPVEGGSYFVIGAEKQFAAYEAYLKSVGDAKTTLYRLYPRDFWVPAPELVKTTGAATAPATPVRP